MATFRIHDDQENISSMAANIKENSQPVQSKRAVLGDININKQSNRNVRHIKSSAVGEHTIKGGFKDENAYNDKISKKVIPSIPVAQFEAFSVYEDVKTEDVITKIKSKEAVRAPLQELNNVDSPMSTGDAELCPMSVDKSVVVKEPCSLPSIERSVRDRFFEVEEYQKDIYQYLRDAELKHRPKPGYMKKQPDITNSMRTILVDWLVEVCEEYRLQAETLSLAVTYIDRFLSYMSVVRAKLQLVGTAAMFIAAKYEEIYPPEASEFVYITDDTYTKKQVLRMEHLILKVLSFDLSVPTQLSFISLYCIENNLGEKTQYMAMYINELSMLEADPYLQYLPSHMAAACLALARHTLGMDAWSEELQESTHYSMHELYSCFLHLHKTHKEATNIPQQAIQEKYKKKYKQVSIIDSRPIEDSAYLSNIIK